jgi:hypothetical protein
LAFPSLLVFVLIAYGLVVLLGCAHDFAFRVSPAAAARRLACRRRIPPRRAAGACGAAGGGDSLSRFLPLALFRVFDRFVFCLCLVCGRSWVGLICRGNSWLGDP